MVSGEINDFFCSWFFFYCIADNNENYCYTINVEIEKHDESIISLLSTKK